MRRQGLRLPGPDEYESFYSTYVGLVTELDIVAVLEADGVAMLDFLGALTEVQADHSYAPGKWSLRQLIGHMIDAEWIFCQRAIWFARGAMAELPGMDQDEWAAAAAYDDVSVRDLCTQFNHLRSAGLMQYRQFSDAVMSQRGRASGCEFSVRALLYILAGHARHHEGVIRERYL